MTAKQFYIIVLFNLTIVNYHFSQSSGYIGGSVGPTAGRFMNFSRNYDYKSSSPLKPGFIASAFYEMREDTNAFFRIGLSYQDQQAFSDVSQLFGHISSSSNLNYNFQQVMLNLDYSFLLTPKKKIDTRLNFGIGGNYSFNTHIAGNGLSIVDIAYVDTNGNEIYTQTQKPWSVNGKSKSAFSGFGFNVHLGWSIGFPLSESANLFFQNSYFLNLGNVIKKEDYGHASFLTGAFELGVRYRLKRK